MIGGAARVGGQKAQCFDCITHPERKKGGQKGVATQNLGFFPPRNENPGDKKRGSPLWSVSTHCCSLSLKKGIVYICRWTLTGQEVLGAVSF